MRPRVYLGGNGFARSFQTYFSLAKPARRTDLVLLLPGLEKIDLHPTPSILDTDASALAGLIERAPDGESGVDMVTHSYGAFVFWHLLRNASLEVQRRLNGATVSLFNTMSHFIDEPLSGLGPEQLYGMTQLGVSTLDAFIGPMRDSYLQALTSYASSQLRSEFEAEWAEFDHLRQRLLLDLLEQMKRPSWQKAFLLRSLAIYQHPIDQDDVNRLRQLIGPTGCIRLFHSLGDTLINWRTARDFIERMGIVARHTPPSAGTVLKDVSGQISIEFTAGDHLLPLKRPRFIARVLH